MRSEISPFFELRRSNFTLNPLTSCLTSRLRVYLPYPLPVDSPFYRVELGGERIEVGFAEVHSLRKDILLYFDDNLEEDISVLMAEGQYRLAYWQYLSLSYEQKWAESVHYQKLVEEGCLSLLNGIALEILDQPITRLDCGWPGVSVPQMLAYLHHYHPSSPRLATAKAHLTRTFSFIQSLSSEDVDGDGMLTHFNPVLAGKWFRDEIVRPYLHWRGAKMPS